MTVARLYRMTAADGREEALATALADAAGVIRQLPGCGGVEVLRDVDRPGAFLLIEKWASVDAHKAASVHLPKGTLDTVMAALAGRPDGSYQDYLLTA